MSPDSPCLALTMGDPAGIGPEIAVQVLARREDGPGSYPIVVGDIGRLEAAAKIHAASLRFCACTTGDEALAILHHDHGAVPVLVTGPPVADVPFGQLTATCGEASWQYVQSAIDLCVKGVADAMVTCPINKNALYLAGHGSSGHTEILRESTGAPWALTMFATGPIRAVFLTRHLSLRDAIASITPELIVSTLRRFTEISPALGLGRPRMAVAALNPHAGEEGLFGSEEQEIITPAIEAARASGLDVAGPVPADAVFYQVAAGRFDAVLCLFHDQAAAPLKAIDFHGTVSVTLGLPFLRFSVDHGTALDIAGKGVADARNLGAVFAYANQMLEHVRWQ